MSHDVVATDFRCTLGSAEFSLGGCDRQALQDILQFLCGLREDSVPSAFAATWKGERSKFELRRVDDGAANSGAGRGLFFEASKRTPAEQSRSAGVGVSGGLGESSAGSTGCKPGGSEGGAGDDIKNNGPESVPTGSSSGTGWRDGVRVGSTAGGVAGVDLSGGHVTSVPFVTIVRGQDRGPNYEYNKAMRQKRRARKEEEKEKVKQQGATSSNWRAPSRTDEEQVLHELRVKRQIIQEKRKLEKLQSPTQMIEDAMRQIEFAEKCAKRANDSRVAAWAAALSNASAESVAKSAGFVGSASSTGQNVSAETTKPSGSTRSKASKKSSREDCVGFGSDAVSRSGRSLNSEGVPYTALTARAWVRRYVYIDKHFKQGRTNAEVAKLGGITEGEVTKYLRLRKEFGITDL